MARRSKLARALESPKLRRLRKLRRRAHWKAELRATVMERLAACGATSLRASSNASSIRASFFPRRARKLFYTTAGCSSSCASCMLSYSSATDFWGEAAPRFNKLPGPSGRPRCPTQPTTLRRTRAIGPATRPLRVCARGARRRALGRCREDADPLNLQSRNSAPSLCEGACTRAGNIAAKPHVHAMCYIQ